MSLVVLWLVSCGLWGGEEFPDPAEGLMARLDVDGSGGLTADELAAMEPQRVLTGLDGDGDGVVSLAELRVDLDADYDASDAAAGTPGGAIGFGEGPNAVPPTAGPPPGGSPGAPPPPPPR